MMISQVWRDLESRARQLEECVRNLQWSIAEAAPGARESHAITDYLETTAQDILESTTKLQQAAARVSAMWNHGDMPSLNRSLRECETHARGVTDLYRDATSQSRLNEIERFARRRGDDWVSWNHGVHDAMDNCHPALTDVHDAITRGWHVLSEHLISVVATLRTVKPRPPGDHESAEHCPGGAGDHAEVSDGEIETDRH